MKLRSAAGKVLTIGGKVYGLGDLLAFFSSEKFFKFSVVVGVLFGILAGKHVWDYIQAKDRYKVSLVEKQIREKERILRSLELRKPGRFWKSEEFFALLKKLEEKAGLRARGRRVVRTPVSVSVQGVTVQIPGESYSVSYAFEDYIKVKEFVNALSKFPFVRVSSVRAVRGSLEVILEVATGENVP